MDAEEEGAAASRRIHAVVAFACLGALIFGLDLGNWAGAIEKTSFVEAFCGTAEGCTEGPYPPEYTDFLSWGASMVQLGACFGGFLVSPPITSRCGRLEAMFYGCAVTIAAVVPMCLVTDKVIFMSARFVTGVGVGMVTYALPIYIAEIAPPGTRGRLATLPELFFQGGIVAASLLNASPRFGTQASFSLPLYPSVVVCLGVFFLPQSPRFVLMKYRRLGMPQEGEELAHEALLQLRGSPALAEAELRGIQAGLKLESAEAPWHTIWTDRSILRRVLIACGLQWMQQFTGIGALLSYGPSMFKAVNIPFQPLAAQVVITTVNAIATLVMMCVIDRCGRRLLLLGGAAAMFVFMAAAGAAGVMMEVYAIHEGTGWMLLACLCGFIFSFGLSWGGTCWVYPSEIFPMDVKEKATSAMTASHYLANFASAFLVPQQVEYMKVYGTFFFYSACLAAIFAVVYVGVPETSGVALEQMDEIFGPRAGACGAPGARSRLRSKRASMAMRGYYASCDSRG